MLFNSFKFILIFPIVFGVYWGIPTKYNQGRNLFLILTSYLLYMNWKPAFALALLAVTLVTYYGAVCIGSMCGCDGVAVSRNEHDVEIVGGGDNQLVAQNRRKRLIWVFALLGLLPLLVFKYYNFINESISAGLAIIGLRFALPGLNWAVPVGISFFTFQSVGYLLDVYHGRVRVERNIVDYILFVSFFPQIVCGPISRADELIPQIKSRHTFDYSQAVSGLKHLLWGMFLKVVLADRAGIYVDTVFGAYENFSGIGCFLASIIYSVQIYADFLGYSLMAIGVAKMLGFNLVNNFNRPYFAVSVSDFWRRWHISFTRWLMRHIYFPLGGSRCSKPRTYWNILVTFCVSGIWHGANWTFISWGCLHGLFLIVERILGWNKKESRGIVKVLRIIITFIVVAETRVLFRSPTIGDAVGFLKRYFIGSGTTIADMSTLLNIVVVLIPLFLYEFAQEVLPKLYERLKGYVMLRWITYLAVLALIVLDGVHDGSSYIYINF